ncbi:hypothetical protein V1525DRAFT_422310 [Lipomyces kononenkoae]|uniref:Uncharacterized protein n=1 Tax=Lipomyces kononenkoae TaxID=34357 RepID=A0ACC3SRX9_LIPKO
MRKPTKKGIRYQAQALAKFRQKLDTAQRRRLKAYEERKRKRQHDAESEEPNFAADNDGWIDVRVDSPPSPLKTMRQLHNDNSDKLHAADVLRAYKQPQNGVTEQINREARQASRQKYHHKIKDEYKNYCSERPIPQISSNDILLIDFDGIVSNTQ